MLFAQGATIPTVVLNFLPVLSKKETQTRYIDMKLEDVVIKSIVAGGGTDEDFFKEHLVLVFDRVSFTYTQLTPVNTANPEGGSVPHKFGWSVSSNEEWTQ